MHLHAARLEARVADTGALILLEEQDRGKWDQDHVAAGLAWLARSARGDEFTRYHAEAAVAAEHCLAPSFAATRWDKIAGYYAQLEQLAPSPLHTLNRAVAVAQWRGPAAGLAIVESLQAPAWLEGSYLFAAVAADLHRRCGNADLADEHAASALDLAPTDAIRAALRARWSRDREGR